MEVLSVCSPVSSYCWKPIVSKATEIWDAVWVKGAVLVHTITWLFFRILSPFFLTIALIEVPFCHGIALIQHFRAKSSISDLEQQIANVKAEKEKMEEDAVITETSLNNHLFERDQAERERDLAREERNSSIQGRASLQSNNALLQRRVDSLEQELSAVRSELTVVKTNAIALQARNDCLNENVTQLQRDLHAADRTQALNSQLASIDQFYSTQNWQTGGASQLVDAEISVLLSTYEKNKQSYRKMLREYIGELEEIDPRRIAVEGLIRMSEEESKHQRRISELYQLLQNARSLT